MGWSTGEAPKVGFVVREGDAVFNDTEAEKSYPSRFEEESPIPDTVYTRFYLTSGMELTNAFQPQSHGKVTYRALRDLKNPQSVRFNTKPLKEETEFTGHIVVIHLKMSASKSPRLGISDPNDIDLFITL